MDRPGGTVPAVRKRGRCRAGRSTSVRCPAEGTLERTNEDYLRWQLGRSARDYAPNVTMLGAADRIEVDLEPGECAVASIVPRGGPPLHVTDARLIRAGGTLLRYGDVARCEWIDRDPEVAAGLRHSHFDRLIFDLKDGREVMLGGLGQAVFPLLSFFTRKLRLAGRGVPAAG